jgi:hypothetical protein
MTQTKRYESADRLESQQIRQADKLSEGWTLWNPNDPITTMGLVLLPIPIVGGIVSFIQAIGNPLIGWLAFTSLLALAIGVYCWRYSQQMHRFSFCGGIWLGFSLYLDWALLINWLEQFNGR